MQVIPNPGEYPSHDIAYDKSDEEQQNSGTNIKWHDSEGITELVQIKNKIKAPLT